MMWDVFKIMVDLSKIESSGKINLWGFETHNQTETLAKGVFSSFPTCYLEAQEKQGCG